ncbi:MAG TPA: hypothetical protein VLX11_10795, partial [Candidatus Acidoferrales bacterium]|nr:hypothetical protein [Candidatus Acidoferrales bacterium]
RYVFPMLLRTRSYDSFIFGSSTGMLVDPQAMDKIFGGRFANLAMTDGKAWEQLDVLHLAIRQTPTIRTLIFTFDWVWCVESMAKFQREIDRFPSWMYDDPKWSNLFRMISESVLKLSIDEIRGQVHDLPSKIRDDGYFVFTPPEQTYDFERARKFIYGYVGPMLRDEIARARHAPAVPISDELRATWRFPALEVLERELASLPDSVKVMIIGMPVHIATQPLPGSVIAARELACKLKADAIAKRHSGAFIDFRIASAVTDNDANYWDALHYRLSTARKLDEAIGTAVRSGKSDPDGFWKIY